MLSKGNAQQLAERTIAVFAARSEVRKIVQFGSLVRGTADQYSDVDRDKPLPLRIPFGMSQIRGDGDHAGGA